jgi:tRNA modification GTPase
VTASGDEGASPARSPRAGSADATRLDPTDTIAAIASPPGPALRGIVRLSGPNAVAVVLGRFSPDDGRPWSGRPEHRSGRLSVSLLDRAIPARLIVWPGTSSYTGGPCAEVHTTGSPPVIRAVLSEMIARGARLAEPGEFTLRAFLAGKIDLTRAEAVLGVIEAQDATQLSAALAQLAGGIAQPIEALRDRLLDLLAHIEANLDFADEPDVDPLGRSQLAEELAEASEGLRRLASRLDSRERGDARPRVLLYGPPNAGKSRLFNALVGGKALVSPEPGTTRDTLSAPCDCDGLEVELIDSAGVESPRSDIEVGAKLARDRELASADLVVVCRAMDGDVTAGASTNGRQIDIVTKCDLAEGVRDAILSWVPLVVPDQCPTITPNALVAYDHWHPGDLHASYRQDAICTSAANGEGLDTLRSAIAARLRAVPSAESVPGTSERCRESLLRAGESLQSAAATLTLGGGDELVAIDLRQALDDLGRVVGTVVADDVLDRIFRKFCIGK